VTKAITGVNYLTVSSALSPNLFTILQINGQRVLKTDVQTNSRLQNEQQEIVGEIIRLLSLIKTRTAQKTTRPTVLPLLRVYSLPR
jgi:hypothetical protein